MRLCPIAIHMILLKIAFRNIFRNRRRSVLTGLMMGGGCFLFSVFIGMVDGTYDNIIDAFTLDHTGHIQIHGRGYLERPSLYNTIKDPDEVIKLIGESQDVSAWAPRVYSSALAFAGSRTSGIRLTGVQPAKESVATRLRSRITSGRFLSDRPLDEIIIGSGLAAILHAGLNDEIAVIAQGADGSVANGLFTVVGITGSSSAYGISPCYVHIEVLQEFLGLGPRIHEIAVVLHDSELTEGTAGVLRDRLDASLYDVDPWQVVEKQFYRAMLADKKGGWLTIMIFTIIISVGVLNTVLMIVLERTREFGVLKALGTRPSQVFLLILLETSILAVLSVLAGTILGLAANWFLSVHGIRYPVPIEYGGFTFDTITASTTVRSVMMPWLIVISSSIAVSIIPALRAARIIPVRAMRSI